MGSSSGSSSSSSGSSSDLNTPLAWAQPSIRSVASRVNCCRLSAIMSCFSTLESVSSSRMDSRLLRRAPVVSRICPALSALVMACGSSPAARMRSRALVSLAISPISFPSPPPSAWALLKSLMFALWLAPFLHRSTELNSISSSLFATVLSSFFADFQQKRALMGSFRAA